MKTVVISGTGLYTPKESISNDELVETFNQYVGNYNKSHEAEIEAGTVTALDVSSSAFIEKASGIKSRYVMNKSGVLDPEVMHPLIPDRPDEAQSLQCEMAVVAIDQALSQSGKEAGDIDFVVVACSNMQRAYPAISVEIQDALGFEGYGYDMNVACSSATFGIQAAMDAIRSGSASCVVVVNPEICSGHLDWTDRDCHFIFGDVCTAIVLEAEETCTSDNAFEMVGTKLITRFSSNIRNNYGFMNRADPSAVGARDKLFKQQGRKVFKEVVPMVSQLITEHIQSLDITNTQLKRLWLHQANLGMNLLITKRVLGREAVKNEAPIILDEFANTSSAGSIVAFHRYSDDFEAGDIGLICSFGAGYSAGSVVVRKR